MLSDSGVTQREAARLHQSSRHSISAAMLIIQCGTREEIDGVEGGSMSMGSTYDAILARTTPDERRIGRKPAAQSAKRAATLEFDALVWGKVRDALDAITGLPSPKDTAAITRKNAMRVEHVNRKLLVAQQWLTEFFDEVTR
jgi:hypothetical protein